MRTALYYAVVVPIVFFSGFMMVHGGVLAPENNYKVVEDNGNTNDIKILGGGT
jgi:hypothetical protein